MQAKDLNKDLFGSNDPFVQIILCKKHNEHSVIYVVKTATVKKVSIKSVRKIMITYILIKCITSK